MMDLEQFTPGTKVVIISFDDKGRVNYEFAKVVANSIANDTITVELHLHFYCYLSNNEDCFVCPNWSLFPKCSETLLNATEMINLDIFKSNKKRSLQIYNDGEIYALHRPMD